MKAQVPGAAQWLRSKDNNGFVNEGEKGQECSERGRAGRHSGTLLASHSSGVNTMSVCVMRVVDRTEKVSFSQWLVDFIYQGHFFK